MSYEPDRRPASFPIFADQENEAPLVGVVDRETGSQRDSQRVLQPNSSCNTSPSRQLKMLQRDGWKVTNTFIDEVKELGPRLVRATSSPASGPSGAEEERVASPRTRLAEVETAVLLPSASPTHRRRVQLELASHLPAPSGCQVLRLEHQL